MSARRNVLERLEAIRRSVRFRVASGECASKDVMDQVQLGAALQATGSTEARSADLAVRYVAAQRELARVTFAIMREIED